MTIYSSYYGSVPMKPEIEKRDFFSGDDDFTYQVPQVYFACEGEIYDSASVKEWGDDFVVVVKGKHIVKYTESNFHELLMPLENGKDEWIPGKFADICGDWECASETRKARSYSIEEYDLDKSEKKTYRVILEETSKITSHDEAFLKAAINNGDNYDSAEYTLTAT